MNENDKKLMDELLDLSQYNWKYDENSCESWTDQFVERIPAKKKKKKKKARDAMKGNIEVEQGAMLITPVHTGFIVFNNPDGGECRIHCCQDWDAVVTFLKENKSLDLTQEQVVGNL